MTTIAWGAKVSTQFLDRVAWIVEDLAIGFNVPDGMSKLMSCIAWESGRTFSAGVTNKAGSGATGLIQFMPDTARKLGTTTAALAKMKAEDQLNYVWKYFAPYKGKLKSLSDLYMAILWPKAVGKPETYVLWQKGEKPTTYRQNAGLDTNKDGDIIKAEASAKLNAMLAEGMTTKNVRDYGAKATAFKEVPVPAVFDTSDTLPLPPVLVPVGSVVEAANGTLDAAKSVTETADTVTSVIVEPKNTATKIKHAISGWQGNFAGAAAVVGALLLDPGFSSLLGKFTTALALGHGRTGALAALVGAGLIAYRTRR